MLTELDMQQGGTYDSTLDANSFNAVQNKVVTVELNKKLEASDISKINGQLITNGGNITIQGGSGDSPIVKGEGENSALLKGNNDNTTNATGNFSTSFGYNTSAIGNFSHAEGHTTSSSGAGSHAEGANTIANGGSSHAEGYGTYTTAAASHAEGYYTNAKADYAHAEGQETNALHVAAHAEGYKTTAKKYAHAEGNGTEANGESSHAEGVSTKAEGIISHAEGRSTLAQGTTSHAEGRETQSHGESSHAEGHGTKTFNKGSHSEGCNTIAGVPTDDSTPKANSLSDGMATHAEGNGTWAKGVASHAEGVATRTNNEAEHAEGKYNVSNINTIHSVGVGTKEKDRKNAHEITNDGKHYILGIGGYDGTKLDGATDVATVINDLKNSDGGSSVTPDWGAEIDQPGYIKNRTHYRNLPRFNPLIYDNQHIETFTGNELPYGYKIQLYLENLYVYNHNLDYIGKINSKEFTALAVDMWTKVKYYDYGGWPDGEDWYDKPCLIVETDFDNINECFDYLNQEFLFGNNLISYQKLSEEYLPNTVLKTTPQTLSNTDKNQALTNLGIDPVVWKYMCNPLVIANGTECPQELLENDELKYKIPAMYVLLPEDNALNNIYRAPTMVVYNTTIETFMIHGNIYYQAKLSDGMFTIEELV